MEKLKPFKLGLVLESNQRQTFLAKDNKLFGKGSLQQQADTTFLKRPVGERELLCISYHLENYKDFVKVK